MVLVLVKLCDPLDTHEPYLSALEIKGLYIKRYVNSSVCSILLTIQEHRSPLRRTGEFAEDFSVSKNISMIT